MAEEQPIRKVVKSFGDDGAHIVLPKKLIGKEVLVTEVVKETSN